MSLQQELFAASSRITPPLERSEYDKTMIQSYRNAYGSGAQRFQQAMIQRNWPGS